MTPLASIAGAVLSATPWRLERRLEVDAKRAALTRIGGAVGAMVVVGILLLLTGRNAFLIFWQALDAIFGRQRGVEGVALRAIPILMTALGVALSLRMKVWNIGSDGQFLMGALAAVGVGIHMDGPGWLVLILMAAAATLAGAAWILVPALARAYWDVNEIITTLLLNFVALQLVTWSAAKADDAEDWRINARTATAVRSVGRTTKTKGSGSVGSSGWSTLRSENFPQACARSACPH